METLPYIPHTFHSHTFPFHIQTATASTPHSFSCQSAFVASTRRPPYTTLSSRCDCGCATKMASAAGSPPLPPLQRQRRRRALPPRSRGPSPRSHRGAPNLLDHRLLISRVKTHGESILKISIPFHCFVFWVLFNIEFESIKLGLWK